MLKVVLPSRSLLLSKARRIGGTCLVSSRGLPLSEHINEKSPFTRHLRGASRLSSTAVVKVYETHMDSAPHCATCTCDHIKDIDRHHTCHDEYAHRQIALLGPSPQPKFSYHRRILPSSLTQLSSPQGKALFRDSFLSQNAEAYFPLSEQFINQSEPAYCAVASLIMVLNAFGIDPNIRWKGGWRWYGSEEMILGQCCIDAGL